MLKRNQINTHDNSDKLSDIRLVDLTVTAKAKQNIQNFTNDLSGRERQLLILLSRDNDFSHKACENLLPKISLSSLMQRGYLLSKLAPEPADTVAEDMGGFNESAATQQASAPVSDNVPEPFLQIAAGNFL